MPLCYALLTLSDLSDSSNHVTVELCVVMLHHVKADVTVDLNIRLLFLCGIYFGVRQAQVIQKG